MNSYDCSAGWLPIQLGVVGAAFGIFVGAGVGISDAAWTEMKEPESERE